MSQGLSCPTSMLPFLNDLPVGVTRGSLSTSDGGVADRAPEESMLITQDITHRVLPRVLAKQEIHCLLPEGGHQGYALVVKLCW